MDTETVWVQNVKSVHITNQLSLVKECRGGWKIYCLELKVYYVIGGIVVGYRVINLKTKEDITDKFDWVITPEGKLFYLDGDSLTGYEDAIYIYNCFSKEII